MLLFENILIVLKLHGESLFILELGFISGLLFQNLGLVIINLLKVGNDVIGVLELDVVETVDLFLESFIVLLLLSLILTDDTCLMSFKFRNRQFVLLECSIIVRNMLLKLVLFGSQRC